MYASSSLTSTIYTSDARFILSGSDDGNVRLWKAHASSKLGVLTTREKSAMEYREALRERWKVDTERSLAPWISSITIPMMSFAALKLKSLFFAIQDLRNFDFCCVNGSSPVIFEALCNITASSCPNRFDTYHQRTEQWT